MAHTLRLFTPITPVLLLALTTGVAAAQPAPTTTQAEGQAPATTAAGAAPEAPVPASVDAATQPASTAPTVGPTSPTQGANESAQAPPPASAATSPTQHDVAAAPDSNGTSDGIQLVGANPSPNLDTLPRAQGPKLPIREQNPWVFSGVVGWNSLVGFGPVVSRHLNAHFTLDAGAGLALEGVKFGAQGRFNFLKSELTPFIGLGAMHALGVDSMTLREARESDDGESIEAGDYIADIRIKPSTFAQVVTGLDWIDRNNNINLTGTLGYAHLLQKDNVEVLDGDLDREHQDQTDISFGSGVVVSLGMGYSF